MGRAPKKGLEYFKRDLGYYEDDKIMDLMDEYGPLGQTIYDVVLTFVYKNGYYLDMPLDKLVRLVVRTVGNRWINDKNRVLQVINYCGEIGLFDKELLSQNVITSVGIQERYADVTARNKVDKSKFWLLETQKPSVSDAENNISATEKPISATEIHINDAEMPQDKIREEKSIEEIYSSCSSTQIEENSEEIEENDDIDVFSMLSSEDKIKLQILCNRMLQEKWGRTANRYDIKTAAGILYAFVLRSYKKNIKNIGITEDIADLLETAVEISADANAQRWSYVKGIFSNWGDLKIKSVEDVAAHQLRYENQQRAKRRNKK